MIITEPPRRRFMGPLLALIAAIVMVGASFAIRQLVIEGDDDDSSSSTTDTPSSDELSIVCAVELADVCARLDVGITLEPAGTTAAKIAAGDELGYDAWVTFAPMTSTVEPEGRTPLILAARTDRAEVLTAHCGGTVTWTCIGEVAGEPWSAIGGEETWGDVKPAHADPVSSGVGRLVLGQAVASFLATEDFSLIDWQSNDAFPGWFQQLKQGVPASAFAVNADPFDAWLRQRLAGFDIVATTEAQAVTELATVAPDLRDRVALIYPAPVATADVVLAPLAGGDDPSALADDLRDALEAQNYRVDDAPPAGAPADAPELPATDGLPPAGVLEALIQLWEGIRA